MLGVSPATTGQKRAAPKSSAVRRRSAASHAALPLHPRMLWRVVRSTAPRSAPSCAATARLTSTAWRWTLGQTAGSVLVSKSSTPPAKKSGALRSRASSDASLCAAQRGGSTYGRLIWHLPTWRWFAIPHAAAAVSCHPSVTLASAACSGVPRSPYAPHASQ